MAERFQKLFTLPPNLYSVGSPIIITGGALLKDTETGKIIAQLKYHSISFKIIKALKIDIAAYDVSGNEIEGVNNYQYLDLNISNGQEFGSNKAIVLPNLTTRSFSINNVSVIFNDGSTTNVVLPVKQLPRPKTLLSELKNEELVKQYQLKTNTNAMYVPFVIESLWICPCGNWNSITPCTNCGLDKKTAIENLDVALLEPEMNKRLQVEKNEMILQRKLEEKKLKEKEAIQKRNKKISIIIAVAIVILVGLAFCYSQHKYDDIAGVYALSNLKKAENAIYELEGDLIDEYGFNPYSYEITIKGSGKIYGLHFVNNRGTLTPRLANIKSVSKDGVCTISVKDYPDAIVTFTVNKETGEAVLFSENKYDSLKLSYHHISEELANNGYQAYSKDEIANDIAFVQSIFELKNSNNILERYQNATTTDAEYDVKIDGAFCGANGSFEIWELNGNIYRVTFDQGIYDINTEKENLLESLNSVLGKYTYSNNLKAYTWKSEEYGLQIDYWPHEEINFFKYSTETNNETNYVIENNNSVAPASLIPSDAILSIENNEDIYSKYSNNIWDLIKNEYGEGESQWFWIDDDDSVFNIHEGLGEIKTNRGILLGVSTEEDIINAYGRDIEIVFDSNTDIVYNAMKNNDIEGYEYLEDSKKVFAYDYNEQFQIVMYTDNNDIVDFILFSDGLWYEN